MRPISIVYILVVWVLFLGTLVGPISAFLGNPSLAESIHSIYKPFCHQYPGRSYALYSDGKVRDCGPSSIYWNSSEASCRYGEVKGFKFPVCARDLGFYYGLAVLSFAYLGNEKKEFPFRLFLLAVVPLAIDGTGQLIGLWESSNIIRLATGFLAGGATSLAVLSRLENRR